jgi:tetratricopeptide (TPR) repeat protein/tRNA A-37 threonylcarbamoyl transferase component Bud32
LTGQRGEGFLASVEYIQNGRYALLKKLGEGGKGIVYKARDTVLNRVVAVKVLKSTVTSDETYSRFMTEAQAVAKLNHPNIVTIHDIGKEDGKQFFVLEFVDGESLRDLMQTYPEGKCDIQTVLRIGMDVCNALQYAHSEKVLHRDIKPENVMITRDGTAKLMDFGLAKMIGQPSVTQEGVIVGTVAYVAPEVALGKGVDSRSDLYSFGAVLYEALSGRQPFPGDDPIKVIFGHIHDHPIPLAKQNPKAPQALVDCIMKLLEKEPEKRYQSAEDLLKVLRNVSEEFLRETLVPSHRSSTVVPSPRPIAAKEIQLIDRVDEMNLLREAVDRAVRGEGGLIFLCGEAGIGKTRLARELRAYARLRGMQVLYGRCPALFRMDGVPPYVLWSEVLRDYLEASSPEQLYRVVGFYPAEVAKLVPELKQRLAAIPQSLPISPEHERDRLFEAVSQFIINVSREGPLLVVLDDLQWTDQTSLLLMHYLARGIYKAPLLLLGAYRETDVDEKHPLSPVLTELNRERLLQSVSLKRMSSNDVSEMIKRILEQDEVPKEFCELVYEKTRGNPFFVEEVVKSLREDEVIFREEDKWKFKQVSKIEFPKTVKGVIKARISRLDDECQNILTMASFVGNDFDFDALHAVTDIEENKLLELMEKLLRTGLVKESVIRGQDIYCFADVVVRDVVHEEVSHLRHNKLHDSVGNALEKVYSKNIDQHFGELAYHFLEGGDKEKALQYFLKAGEKAQRIYAHSEALSYLEHALELLEEKENNLGQKVKIIEKLGDLKAWMGEADAGMEYWIRALTLWNKSGDKRNIAGLHAKMAWWLWNVSGNKEKAAEHHRMALEILEKEPESVELASLYEDISHMLWRTGESAEALSWAQKALKLAERLDASEVLAWCYNDLGVLNVKLGESEKALQYYEQGLKIALEKNFAFATTLYNNLCDFYFGIGELQKMFETAKEGSELARKLGNPYGLVWIDTMLASSYALMGDTQTAFPMLEDVVALDKRTKNTSHLSYAIGILGVAYCWLGEWDKSLQCLMEARDLAKEIGEYQSSGNVAEALGELYMEMEDYSEAEKYFNEGRSIWEKAGDTSLILDLFPALSKLYLKKGDIEKAEELIEKILEHATKTKNRLLISHADMLKAMLFREQKNWEQSIEYFEKSLQGYKSLNAHKWYVYRFAELLCEYALMHLNRNQEGDKEKAYSLLNHALEIYQKMDAKKKIEEIIAKKKLLTA